MVAYLSIPPIKSVPTKVINFVADFLVLSFLSAMIKFMHEFYGFHDHEIHKSIKFMTFVTWFHKIQKFCHPILWLLSPKWYFLSCCHRRNVIKSIKSMNLVILSVSILGHKIHKFHAQILCLLTKVTKVTKSATKFVTFVLTNFVGGGIDR